MRLGEDKSLTLKNGETVNAREAANAYQWLTINLRERPQHVAVLRDIIAGKTSGHPEESITFLTETRLISTDLTISPLERSIFESGCIETADGVVFGNPFNFKDESERRVVLEIQAANGRRLRDILRGDSPETPGESPGRG